jgi:flagellar biosynthesis protein FlhF
MRVVNQITFEAKDDAEALRLAGERLGKDAVVLSTRTVHVGGLFGFFQRPVLMVSAGILQDEQTDAKGKGKEKGRERDSDVTRENLVAFQKILELKQASEARSGRPDFSRPDFPPADYPAEPQSAEPAWFAPAEDSAKVIYSPLGNGRIPQVPDSVHLSPAGLSSAGHSPAGHLSAGSPPRPGSSHPAAEAAAPPAGSAPEAEKLREEVASLSKQLKQLESLLLGKQAGAAEGAAEKKNAEKENTEESSASASGEAEKNSPDELPDASEAADRAVPAAPRIEEDEFYQKLLSAEVDPQYARQMTEEYRNFAEGRTFAQWLETKVRCAGDTPSGALGGRKVMLIGPTGVGKTTTIAKLTAIQALQEQKKVLLLTSDTYRIAAVDQLQTYAKILGVPIEVIYEVENFVNAMEGYTDSELILLDTAGRGQKDRKNLDTCEILYSAFRPDAVHLVLSANMKYRDMQDIIERMAVVPVSHVIFTKMDETVSYGALFNVMRLLNRPISFLTTGQNVPNDIEVASGARFVNLLLGDGREFR